MRRRDVWQRSQLLQKIENDTAKAHTLLEQRSKLQEARKQVTCVQLTAVLLDADSTSVQPKHVPSIDTMNIALQHF